MIKHGSNKIDKVIMNIKPIIIFLQQWWA